MDDHDATGLGRLDVRRHDGGEPFHARSSQMLPFTLVGFWQWSPTYVEQT